MRRKRRRSKSSRRLETRGGVVEKGSGRSRNTEREQPYLFFVFLLVVVVILLRSRESKPRVAENYYSRTNMENGEVPSFDIAKLRTDIIQLEKKYDEELRQLRNECLRNNTSLLNTLTRYVDADRVGKIDFALKMMGGEILRSSPSFVYKRPNEDSSWYTGARWLLSRTLGEYNHPSVVIDSQDTPLGECWSFEGSRGFVTIRLGFDVLIESVSIDHAHASVALDLGHAPRAFSVYGLASEYDNDDDGGDDIDDDIASNDEAHFLGRFEFAAMAVKRVQTFRFDRPRRVRVVQFNFHSNWGSDAFTCIYRLRVHGEVEARD